MKRVVDELAALSPRLRIFIDESVRFNTFRSNLKTSYVIAALSAVIPLGAIMICILKSIDGDNAVVKEVSFATTLVVLAFSVLIWAPYPFLVIKLQKAIKTEERRIIAEYPGYKEHLTAKPNIIIRELGDSENVESSIENHARTFSI